MPRRPRLELPEIPFHVTQRVVHRCAILVDDVDRHHLHQLLCNAMHTHRINIHAYVFMGNHIHLVLTPNGRNAL